MTWIYKPKSVSSLDTLASHSDLDSPASMPAPSATSSENPTASLYYKHTSPVDVSTTPPYGTTSEPLTDGRGAEPTSSPQGSLVSHTAWQVSEASTTTEISGPTHSGSLAKWSPDTYCWRTYQASMWAMLDGQLTGEPWSDNFPNWGTMRNGELIPLPMPEPLTVDGDGGFLPIWNTPNTMDSLSAKSQDALDYEHRTARPGRSNPNNLRDQIAVDEGMRTWATPTVNDSKNNAGPSERKRHGPSLNVQAEQTLWPTPRAIYGEHPGMRDLSHLTGQAIMWPTPKSTRSGPDYAREGRDGSGGDDLATFVAKEENTWPTPSSASQGEERRTMVQGSGGALSADWVEWLMGVPQGWSIAEPCADYDTWLQVAAAASHWLEEQGLPRTIVGQENRVSRLKMLGNGIVPSAAAMAIKELSARLLQE